MATTVYKRSHIGNWLYPAKDLVKCTQIVSKDDLTNEGRIMHNCVASYHYACASGESEIFSLSCNNVKIATLEVSGMNVVQARGPCNQALKGDALKYYKRWCREKALKDLCYFDQA